MACTLEYENAIYDIYFTSIPCGDEYKRINQVLFSDVDVVLMCFSMTDPQSLQHLITIHNQDIQNCKYKILVGTHSDDINNQAILDYL